MGKKNPEGFRSSCTVFLNFVIPLGYVAEEIRNLELEYNYYFSDMLTQPFEPAELHALHVHVLGVLCSAIGWCHLGNGGNCQGMQRGAVLLWLTSKRVDARGDSTIRTKTRRHRLGCRNRCIFCL